MVGAGLPLLQRLRLLRDRPQPPQPSARRPGEPGTERRTCPPVLKLLQGRAAAVSVATQTGRQEVSSCPPASNPGLEELAVLPLDSPPESDTAERRGLRSILRRLGDSAETTTSPTVSPNVQGYLARKRNLLKSVSFTDRSPPSWSDGSGETLPDVASQTPRQPRDLVAEIRTLLHDTLVSAQARGRLDVLRPWP